jgi:hypothetical protein
MRSPEGATGISGYVPRRLVSGRPPGMSKRQRVECFRASGIKPKTQGKPWAKFFSPFGAGRFGLGNHAQHLTTKLSRFCREFCSLKSKVQCEALRARLRSVLSLRDTTAGMSQQHLTRLVTSTGSTGELDSEFCFLFSEFRSLEAFPPLPNPILFLHKRQ